MLIQFLLIALVLLVAVLALGKLPGEKSLAVKRLLALVFVAAAIVAILFPQLLSALASFFGVGRGTDLLLYLFVIAAMIFAVMTIRAKARSDARVTELARAVALIEARESSPPADSSTNTR